MGSCITNKKDPAASAKPREAKKEKAISKRNQSDYSIANVDKSTVVKGGKYHCKQHIQWGAAMHKQLH